MSIDATSGQKTTVTQQKSTVQQTKKSSFFKKIGNWFNKNGNTVGNVMSAVGDTAMSTGMTLAQMEVMRKGSIWGMGFMGCGMPLGYGMDYYTQCDPLGISGWMGYGAGGYNPYLTQMGNQMAFDWGAVTMQQMMAQQQLQANQYSQFNINQNVNQNINVNQKIQADFAELDVSKQDTKDGKEFDDATNGLTDEKGNAISGKKYSFGITDKKDYSEKIQEKAKNYVAHIDKESGNSDGAITLEEYTKHEMAKLPSDATEEQKAQAKKMAEIAFNKLDLTGDNKLDWKEYSAALSTFDQKFGGTELDGTITSEDYSKWSTELGGSTGTKFENAARTNYLSLFKKKEE